MNKFERILNIIFEKEEKKSKMDRLIKNCEEAYKLGGLPAVQELCRNTKGKEAAAIYFFIDKVLTDK